MRILNVKVTFWRIVFVLIMVPGVYSTYLRFAHGLGAATNMTDRFPWGLWIGFDCLCGIMLAAGGFCVTGAVYLFKVDRLHSIIRPTILTAFLGYLLFIVGLLFDLGRPWYIWHQLIYMNPHSVMFEVGVCVMTYTAVLAFEFLPIVLERFHLNRLLKWAKALMPVSIIAGVLLSTLHQSSLGSLFLIFPGKMHPFWYSPAQPFFFFASAIACGLAMTIFESTLSARAFGRSLELPVLSELGDVLLVVLWVNAFLRLADFYHRGQFPAIFRPSYEAYFLWIELALAFVIPLAMLGFRKVRRTPDLLYVAALSTILGFVTNRLNVGIISMEIWNGKHYEPKWTELSITLMIVAMGFFLFTMAVKYLPIYAKHEAGHTGTVAAAGGTASQKDLAMSHAH